MITGRLPDGYFPGGGSENRKADHTQGHCLEQGSCRGRYSPRHGSRGRQNHHGFAIDRALRAIFGCTEATPGSRVSARDPWIGKPGQQGNPPSVLRRTPVAHLCVSKVMLHIQERMLDLRPHGPFSPLCLFPWARPVPHTPPATPHRHLPCTCMARFSGRLPTPS